MKKYEFTGKTINHLGRELKQIRRLRDGFVGGYIESERNLSHNGDCFVYGNAWVCGNASVSENAWVSGNASVFGNTKVCGNAWVCGNASVSGNASVYGNASVSGNASVYGDAEVFKYEECVNITNQKHNITLTPNLIIIGCKTWKTLEDFEKTYKQIGLENNYTEDECEMIAELVRTVMRRIGKSKPETVEIEHNGRKYEIDIEKAKELWVLK